MIHFVLASSSPARLATLKTAGIEPRVVVSGIDEDAVLAAAVAEHGKLTPAESALLLARAKAEAVRDGCTLVLGCDSVLELDGQAYGKPADATEAVDRWRAMRGRSGVLHTGHWLVDNRATGPRSTGDVASTTVHFADVSDEEIEAYVATGEPLQVAGAFTIDGLGGPFVTGVEGDHHAVVGLSLPLLRVLLAEFGIRWHELW
ncbi:MAG TPA: Maf family protein [Jiangellaceae bacterium]|nr:Maf family protein [Jiangellaceae bacterium]